MRELFFMYKINMKLVFATHNLNKFKEVQSLLPDTIELVSLTDIGCYDDIPETETTIEGNALLKVKHIKDNYGLDCFADDTGLEIESLNNEPGVFSARYSGEKKNAEDNMNLVLQIVVTMIMYQLEVEYITLVLPLKTI